MSPEQEEIGLWMCLELKFTAAGPGSLGKHFLSTFHSESAPQAELVSLVQKLGQKGVENANSVLAMWEHRETQAEREGENWHW